MVNNVKEKPLDPSKIDQSISKNEKQNGSQQQPKKILKKTKTEGQSENLFKSASKQDD